jgi:prepilin-type N-terminal cleavage/methylation domain-containing protein
MTQHKKGFTLVELSIVLIIIGLIIGGVLKGTDMINSAKQKKVYNTWIKGWQVAINTYQDRTGMILADGPAATTGGSTAAANGTFDNVLLDPTGSVQTVLRNTGIDIPVTSSSATGGTYNLEGKNRSGLSVMTLANVNFGAGNPRNVIQISNVPNDIAMALDTMIDGVANAGAGDCRRINTNNPAGVTPWGTAAAAAVVVNIAVN